MLPTSKYGQEKEDHCGEAEETEEAQEAQDVENMKI